MLNLVFVINVHRVSNLYIFFFLNIQYSPQQPTILGYYSDCILIFVVLQQLIHITYIKYHTSVLVYLKVQKMHSYLVILGKTHLICRATINFKEWFLSILFWIHCSHNRKRMLFSFPMPWYQHHSNRSYKRQIVIFDFNIGKCSNTNVNWVCLA